MIKIKICGITSAEELSCLEGEQIGYAGFVLYEKSKRYIPIAKTKCLFGKINPNITKVAVTVNPDMRMVNEINQAGFDILQVHGILSDEVQKSSTLPIWLAVNISGIEDLLKVEQLIRENNAGITAVVVDAKEYGGGKTFGWENFSVERNERFRQFRRRLQKLGIQFVLAGGLNTENVAHGIAIFEPDIVDVSTGVERDNTDVFPPGKDLKKIHQFVQNVGNAE